jgi:hypothetical protein
MSNNDQGQVDTGFLTSYTNAKDAGFSAPNEVDAYMFPCMASKLNKFFAFILTVL